MSLLYDSIELLDSRYAVTITIDGRTVKRGNALSGPKLHSEILNIGHSLI